jgi:hypothetical protein
LLALVKRFYSLQYATMKKTTTTNSADLAAINFETSNFSFKIKDDYLHVLYDCKSLET